jgi:protoheme IX farnesyltransferase
MLLAQDFNLDYPLMLYASIGIYLAASAAAVINHVVDQKIDAIMDRTKSRPLIRGNVTTNHAIYFSLSISLLSTYILFEYVNTITTILTLFSIIVYSIIYSVYLKNLTSQNIVIGGIAGAMPPLLGWTAMTNSVSELPLLLFLIIFLWTPPHFWALAVYKQEDYSKANVPMLPVTHGADFTRLHIFLYSILLFCITLFPYLLNLVSYIYLISVLILGGKFIIDSYSLYLTKNDRKAFELFKYSIAYLALLFAALLFDHYILML